MTQTNIATITLASTLSLLCVLALARPALSDPFADTVTSFTPGSYVFGSVPPPPGEELNATGAPDGALISLGLNGEIILEFVDNVAIDGPGNDIRVNAFVPGSGSQELDNRAEVLVSDDGVVFVSRGNIGPGGTTFPVDLAGSGLTQARFVKVVDSGSCCLSGNPAGGGDGFNIESLEALNSQDVAQAPDHFLLYDVRIARGTSRFERRSISLADQFDEDGVSRIFIVDRVKELGNPVDKNGEGISDPDTHLTSYRIRRARGESRHQRLSGVKVTNQFGVITLDTGRPDRLLVPSAKDLIGPIPDETLPDPFPIDHFKCYTVRVTAGTAPFELVQVSALDQFTQPAILDLRRPQRLCNPVDKDGGGIANPDAHLLCYRAKRVESPVFERVEDIHIDNQFGPLVLDARRERALCVPSEKDISNAVPIVDDDDDDDDGDNEPDDDND